MTSYKSVQSVHTIRINSYCPIFYYSTVFTHTPTIYIYWSLPLLKICRVAFCLYSSQKLQYTYFVNKHMEGSELGTFVLDNHNPEHLISISTVDTYNLRITVIPSGYNYSAGYRIKIKLIRRLTKDLDQALISISTLIQQFPPWVYPPWSQIVHINLKLELLKPKIQWIQRKGLQWVLYRVYRTIIECP